LTILIAEDDMVSSMVLAMFLTSENITTLSAVNGVDAVKMVQQYPEINLVLKYLNMPIMNGLEATKLIKQYRPDLPVIAQSAFAAKGDKQKAKVAGCDSFITKPINKNRTPQSDNRIP